MGGLSFLTKKYWHPSRPDNLERVWIREQKVKAAKKREAERQKERQAEADRAELLNSMGAEGEKDALKAQVSFMYAAPPGYKEMKAREEKEQSDKERAKQFDDDCSFDDKLKRMQQLKDEDATTRAERRKQEREMEEKMSHSERIKAHFPQLKDAPVVGDYVGALKAKHKPLGVKLRNVRCVRCGEWGHVTGDRECELIDINPNDPARIRAEDPLTTMKAADLHAMTLKEKEKAKEKDGGGKSKRAAVEERNRREREALDAEAERRQREKADREGRHKTKRERHRRSKRARSSSLASSHGSPSPSPAPKRKRGGGSSRSRSRDRSQKMKVKGRSLSRGRQSSPKRRKFSQSRSPKRGRGVKREPGRSRSGSLIRSEIPRRRRTSPKRARRTPRDRRNSRERAHRRNSLDRTRGRNSLDRSRGHRRDSRDRSRGRRRVSRDRSRSRGHRRRSPLRDSRRDRIEPSRRVDYRRSDRSRSRSVKRERKHSRDNGSRSPRVQGPPRPPASSRDYRSYGDVSAQISGFIKEERQRGKDGRHARDRSLSNDRDRKRRRVKREGDADDDDEGGDIVDVGEIDPNSNMARKKRRHRKDSRSLSPGARERLKQEKEGEVNPYARVDQPYMAQEEEDGPKFVLRYRPGQTSPIRGGGAVDDPNQKLLSDSESEGDEDVDSDVADREFIESLPEERKRLLYKMLTDAEKKEKRSKKKKSKKSSKKTKEKKRRKKKEKKHRSKRKKRRRREDSDSSGSDSDSD